VKASKVAGREGWLSGAVAEVETSCVANAPPPLPKDASKSRVGVADVTADCKAASTAGSVAPKHDRSNEEEQIRKRRHNANGHSIGARGDDDGNRRIEEEQECGLRESGAEQATEAAERGEEGRTEGGRARGTTGVLRVSSSVQQLFRLLVFSPGEPMRRCA